ncbi:MAG TPA: GNAT family N-acetyltransferase, partial [Polyangiaceae bacterium]|nr:GNAT family N-acetyltransferase [Polyangiaceae bacterium]
LSTVSEAVALIKPGQRILIGSGAAEPVSLVEGLVEQANQLWDNEIVHLLTLGPAPYAKPEFKDRFRHKAFFIGPNVREAVQDGRADFIPVFLSEIPELIRSRRVRIDVALIQVSPPDAHGFVSLGVSVDVVRAAVDAAEVVLAEVNPQMPRTHGDSFIHLRCIDRLIPVNRPLLEARPGAITEIERQIGKHVASLIADGSTLQTGIGRIPDAVLFELSGHRDLGVHTEMLSDGLMRLFEAGVITGAKKTLLPGKMLTSFVMGSRELYAWANENPALEMRPSDFTNDPMVIARNDQMVSINSALAVDLTGQVASDTLQGQFYSGIGGQVDFVRGAARSRGGKAIIALSSTAKSGDVSRIQAGFEQGAGVVTSRGDVRYVVTEYGIADLWGKSVRERALALIEIAHPRFKKELLSQAKERKYVFADQRAPRDVSGVLSESREPLTNGAEVVIRPVRLSDEEGLKRLLYELSPESTYQRFFEHKRIHSHRDLQKLLDADNDSAIGLLALSLADGELVAMSRYDVEPSTGLADVAFVVKDTWQHRGIGTLLLRKMAEVARSRGLSGLSADVLSSNAPMRALFTKCELPISTHRDGEVLHLEARFELPSKTLAATGSLRPPSL